MATCPTTMLGIIMGRMYGLTQSGPRVLSTSRPSSSERMPPMPVPHTVPMRSDATEGSIREWAMASAAATRASWPTRSRCLARRRPKMVSASNPSTSAAMRTG